MYESRPLIKKNPEKIYEILLSTAYFVKKLMNCSEVPCIDANLAEYHSHIKIDDTIAFDFVPIVSVNELVSQLRKRITTKDLIEYNWIVDELTNFELTK